MNSADWDALPDDVGAEIHQRLIAFLREIGVQPTVGPDGSLAIDLMKLAPALGIPMDQCLRELDEAGAGTYTMANPDDLVPLQ